MASWTFDADSGDARLVSCSDWGAVATAPAEIPAQTLPPPQSWGPHPAPRRPGTPAVSLLGGHGGSVSVAGGYSPPILRPATAE